MCPAKLLQCFGYNVPYHLLLLMFALKSLLYARVFWLEPTLFYMEKISLLCHCFLLVFEDLLVLLARL